MRCALYELLKEFRTEKCPFGNLPEKPRGPWALNLTNGKMQNCQWFKHELMAQIGFTDWTPDGHLRRASFAGMRGRMKSTGHRERIAGYPFPQKGCPFTAAKI